MTKAIPSMYSSKVMKHIRHPQNMGEIKKADGIGTVGNRICGDIMRFYLKVSKTKQNQEIIQDIKFQTLGCGAAIATSSFVTTLVKGKPLKEAEEITKEKIISALGGLPSTKFHCSVLAVDALKKAIDDYRNRARTLR